MMADLNDLARRISRVEERCEERCRIFTEMRDDIKAIRGELADLRDRVWQLSLKAAVQITALSMAGGGGVAWAVKAFGG